MRTGRITASRFKAACNTNPACPAKSLIFAICYPEMAKFRSKQTTWGCNDETIAREKYNMLQQTKQQNFDVANCGLSLAQTMVLWVHRRMDCLVVPVVVMECVKLR